MTTTEQPASNPCRCGCGGTSRGLFVPGHDARYKSQLAKRLHEALTADPAGVFDGPGEAARIQRECDAIDLTYARPAGKWWALVAKQAENLRLNAARDVRRADRGTPVRRAARKLMAASRDDSAVPGDATAADVRGRYIDDLMDRLQHRRAAGMVGWALIDGERTAVRIWETGLDRGISTIKVRVIVTGEFYDLAPDLFHRDIELEHAN